MTKINKLVDGSTLAQSLVCADVSVVLCCFLIMLIYIRNQHVHRYHHHVLYLCHVLMEIKKMLKKKI